MPPPAKNHAPVSYLILVSELLDGNAHHICGAVMKNWCLVKLELCQCSEKSLVKM